MFFVKINKKYCWNMNMKNNNMIFMNTMCYTEYLQCINKLVIGRMIIIVVVKYTYNFIICSFWLLISLSAFASSRSCTVQSSLCTSSSMRGFTLLVMLIHDLHKHMLQLTWCLIIEVKIKRKCNFVQLLYSVYIPAKTLHFRIKTIY